LVIAVAPSALAKKGSSGTNSVGCLVNDPTLQTAEGLSNTDDAAIVSISPASLWPPNHKLRDESVVMTLNPKATSTPSSPVNVSLTVNSITDDQVADDDAGGHGCGKPSAAQGSDWQPTGFPSSPANGSLQATTDQVSLTGVQLRGER